MRAEVAATIVAHDEGPLLAKAIASARAAIRCASDTTSCEIIVALNRADSATREIALAEASSTSSEGAPLRVLEVDGDDPAAARMAAAEASQSRWMVFLDGDDLWGASWIREACAFAATLPEPNRCVLHPELSVAFGARREIWTHLDSEDPAFRPHALLARNAWTALAFVPRALLLDIPMSATRAQDGFGFEDWRWNCETFAAGVRHAVVPRTVHFVRVRTGSRGHQHRVQAAILPPTTLSSPARLRELAARLPSARVAAQPGSSLKELLQGAETAVRRARASVKQPIVRAALRATAAGLHRAASDGPRQQRLALPAWAEREREALAVQNEDLARAAGRLRHVSLNEIGDPEALAKFVEWCQRWEGCEELEIGRKQRAVGVDWLALRPLPFCGRWADAGEGLLLSDARLNWLARGVAQAEPHRVHLDDSLTASRLLELHGKALRSLDISINRPR